MLRLSTSTSVWKHSTRNKCYERQNYDKAGFESDGNARERRSRSFLYNGNVVPVVFFCILQLLTVILSSLIFISLVGQPLTQFNPLPYVKKWLAHGHSGAYDNAVKKSSRNERIALQPFKQNFRVTSVVDQRNFIRDYTSGVTSHSGPPGKNS